MKPRYLAGVLLVISAGGCYPTTTRPDFLPQPTATIAEIELPVPEATRAVAVALDADSIPVRRTESKDGWIESEWFDAATLKPFKGRPLGPGIVQVRAWIDPSRPSSPRARTSNITIETIYRAMTDPSRPERDLDLQVPVGHPVGAKMVLLQSTLARLYGGVAIDTTKQVTDSTAASDPAAIRKRKGLPPDTATAPVKKPAKPDSTAAGGTRPRR